MTNYLSVDDFWKTARELTMGLWNRLEKKGVQWMERDQTWYNGVSALAKLCRSDQEQRRFKYWEDMAVSLFNRTRMTLWDWEVGKPKINAEAKRHFINSVRSMTEEDWDLYKRSQAITRIANYWIKKGEDEEDVSGWLSEQIHREWDLAFKYEDWKYGNF